MKGVDVERIYVGTFMTSLEMAGVSITLLHLNEERKKYLGIVASKIYLPYCHTVCTCLKAPNNARSMVSQLTIPWRIRPFDFSYVQYIYMQILKTKHIVGCILMGQIPQ